MSLTTDGSLYFEILDDGTTRSDHSAVIQLAINTCDCNRILKELSERRMAK